MSNASQPANPDNRPLPDGWAATYSASLQVWGYWDTWATPKCHTWVHPADPQPVNPDSRRLPNGWYSVYDPASERWAYVNTMVNPRSHALVHPLDPQPDNPDTRLLPEGWYGVYDPAFGQWLYINTEMTGPSSHVWVHPNDTPPPNPDNRPLPQGWISKYDPRVERWFYVNTTTIPHQWAWGHPLTQSSTPEIFLIQGIVAKLANFGNDNQVSPVVDPNGWLAANMDQVWAILQDFHLTFPGNEDYLELFGSNPIYPRFMAYIIVHLKLSEQNKSLDSLKRNLVNWAAFEDMERLASCRDIIRLLWEYGTLCVSFNRNKTHDESLVELLDLDVKGICAQLICVLKRSGNQAFLAHAKNAQCLLDLLQAILDSPRLDPRIRSFIVPMLTKLAQKSGRYPESLLVSGVRVGDMAIAVGSFGEVRKGEANGHAVAVKVLRVFETSNLDELFKNFSREIVVWRQLSHPNVLPFYGVHHLNGSSARVCLISPWMENGDVVQYLRRTPNADKASLIQDVAQGLDYLHIHKPPIIHGDLKGVNILITRSRRACIADFGLSCAVDTRAYSWASSSTVGAAGTLRWLAPELFNFDGPETGNTLASDIYALGCVFYEIFSGRVPFYEFNEFRVIPEIMRGNRPSRPNSAPGLDDEMWDLIGCCWEEKPAKRPTATDVVRRLCSHPSQSQYAAPQIWEDSFTSSLRSSLGVYPAELEEQLTSDASRLAPPGRPRVSATGQETFTSPPSPSLAATRVGDRSSLAT